jgi:mono/diheme cytochrome c family protein
MLPVALLSLFAERCQTCHGNPPLPTVPGSLTSYEDLARPAKTDPTRTMAEMALARIRNTAAPMPPLPGSPVPDAEARFLETWIETGMPLEGCSSTDGGPPAPRPDAGPPAATPPPVFNTPSVCTSKRTYQGGNNQRMRPGDNCLNCHGFDAAGTVYPTAHEPRFCNGVDGDDEASGAQVVVTDSQGRTSTARVNNVGNFIFRGNLRPPLRVKVTFQGRERLMISMAPAGSCNRCHTEDGTTTVNGGPKAPGRIVLP